jgi:nitroreductase
MYRPLADDGIVRRLLTAAAAAPSIHNTQPWRFRVAGDDLIEVHGDPDRMLWAADPHGRALHLSCGAARRTRRSVSCSRASGTGIPAAPRSPAAAFPSGTQRA